MAKKPIFNKSSIPRPQMEVYTSGHAKSWMWNALPGPLASLYSLVIAGSVTGLAYFFGDHFANGSGYTWSLIAIGVMTVIGLIAGGFRAARAKKEASEGGDEGFGDALKASASGWDSGASDPAEIARLDDLRKNFQKGIDTFTEYGKDLYALPWYVIMGEPGSGKTEAIRRSELRFPEALQDKLQGTGGTYSMHWWFTNQAIIIDTAGAMLLQPEASGRFEEFLALLRSHRKDCPINGLILTIPVDSLLSDSPPAAEQKAKMIAIQLGIIQKALDVRFPIYVMISKSDRLPGFREYFDADGQSAFERQMIGWSNPDPLGTPFEPERIYEAVDTIANRLQSRALALLAEPIPPNPASRRLDEVDSVYNFPQVIRTLAPRLRLYLDVIFQTGTWATKPPFFRGIYFTSALREGAQLDLQLAQALGLPLQQLPPGGIFSREKAVFLRDVFIEKIFMERGLVTRLVDIGAHLRKRLMTFYGVTATLLLLAIGFAWFVKTRLRDQLDQEQDYWSSANVAWDNGSILPLAKRMDNGPLGRPQWIWRGDDLAKGNTSRIKLLKEINERVNTPLAFSWVFSPISEWRDYLQRRREGYLTVVEGSILKPVIDGVRERIFWDTAENRSTSSETQKKLAEAYQQLLKLEAWLTPNSSGHPVEQPDEKAWAEFVTVMTSYLLDPELPGGWPGGQVVVTPGQAKAPMPLAADLEEMARMVSQIYGKKVDLLTRRWMSEQETATKETSAIARAADFVFGHTVQQASMNDQKRVEIAQRKVSAMAQLDQSEKALLRMVTDMPSGPRSAIESNGMKPLLEAADNYQKILAEEQGESRSSLSVDLVTNAARRTREVADLMDGQLPDGLKAALGAATPYAGGQAHGSVAAADDHAWLAISARITKYKASFEPLKTATSGMAPPQIGTLRQTLERAASIAGMAGAEVAPQAKDAPAAADDTERLCNYLKNFRGTPLVAGVFNSYATILKSSLDRRLKFPLVNCNAEHPDFFTLQADCTVLDTVEKDSQDLALLTGSVYQSDERRALEQTFQNLRKVFDIKKALLGTTGVQQDGALWISLDAVKKAEETIKQVNVPPAGVVPFGAPPPPMETQTQKLRDGCVNIKVMIAGSVKLDQEPTGREEKIFFKGFERVDIELSFERSGQVGNTVARYRSDNVNWPILRRLARGTNRFPIESTGRSFQVGSSPLLPNPWPTRQEFGLEPEPPR